MKTKVILFSLISIVSLIGCFYQNSGSVRHLHYGEQGTHQVADVSDSYDDFKKNHQIIDDNEFSRFYCTDFMNQQIIQFLELNINILTNTGYIKTLNQFKNIRVRYHVPKLTGKPALDATVDYGIIMENATAMQKPKVLILNAWLERNGKNQPWRLSKIFGKTIKTGCFSNDDFTKLGLVFKQKLLLKNLPKNDWPKYTMAGYTESNHEIYQKIAEKNYAIYKFELEKNGILLQFTFTVGEKPYIENKKNQQLPYEWSQVFIERVD